MTDIPGDITAPEDPKPLNSFATGIFLAVAFLVPVVLLWQFKSQGLVVGEDDGPSGMVMIGIALLPGLGALLARSLGKEGWADARPRWMGAGTLFRIYFVTMGLTLLTFIITALAGLAEVDAQMTGFKEMLRPIMEQQFAAGGQTMTDAMFEQALGFAMISQYLVFVIGPFFVMAIVLPQEWGWRGYLFPRLTEAWGPKSAAWAIAVPAGVITWLSISLTGEMQLFGHTAESAAVGGAVSSVFLAFIACWVFRRTGSVWASALFFASAQMFSQLPMLFLTNPTQWLAAPFGAAYTAVAAAVAFRVAGLDWTPFSEYTPDPEEDDWGAEEGWADPAPPAPPDEPLMEGSIPDEPPSKE